MGRPWSVRQQLLVLAVVGVLLGGGSATLVYEVTKPLALVVTDGSITGVLEGNFAKYVWTNATLLEYFNATTNANQSGGPTSTLTLRLLTSTYSYPQGVFTAVFAMVQGEFASNLNLTGLTLACNETGNIWNVDAGPWLNSSIQAMLGPWPGSTNVTYSGPMITGTNGTGSVALTPTLVNETGKGPFYEFAFSGWFTTTYPLDPSASNGFLGFRATVTGRFTPDVSVGFLLHVLDVP